MGKESNCLSLALMRNLRSSIGEVLLHEEEQRQGSLKMGGVQGKLGGKTRSKKGKYQTPAHRISSGETQN